MRLPPDASRLAALVLAGAVTAGCVTSTDPRDGGLINGVSGIINGSYQRRVDQRQAELDELARTRAEMDQKLRDTQQQRGEVATEALSLQQELTDLQAQSERTRLALAEIHRNHLLRSEELDMLGDERNAIERSLIDLMKRYGIGSDAVPAMPMAPTDVQELRTLQAKQRRVDEAVERAFAKSKKRAANGPPAAPAWHETAV